MNMTQSKADPTSFDRDDAHTPGPWRVSEPLGQRGAEVRHVSNLHTPVCMVNSGCRPEGEANARLIAAAPDLLAALEDMREQLRAHVRLDVKKHYRLMVADAAAGSAILKARKGAA